jgi:hypothetical protein
MGKPMTDPKHAEAMAFVQRSIDEEMRRQVDPSLD